MRYIIDNGKPTDGSENPQAQNARLSAWKNARAAFFRVSADVGVFRMPFFVILDIR